jgi:shikimate dehydrogenase
MRKFGLIGYPLGHSFSKKYFTDKFSREHLDDCSYDNYPLTDIGQLPELTVSESSLMGLNVTIPYKTEVLKYLDEIDPESYQVGAVNVIKIKRSATTIKLAGFNSDIFGIKDTLMPVVSDRLKNALVLGTGGSSKAVCYVLSSINVNYTLVSRSPQPGCIMYSDIVPGLLGNTQLIINTTPLGMYPDIDSKPDLNYDLLNNSHILFDLVYNPEITTFLKIGQERGCKIINGMKMLVSQAEKSWKIWNDDRV